MIKLFPSNSFTGEETNKIELPLYHEGCNEEFLCLVQDVENWMTDCKLNHYIHIDQVYKSFVDCLKGDARDICISILRETPGKKTLSCHCKITRASLLKTQII